VVSNIAVDCNAAKARSKQQLVQRTESAIVGTIANSGAVKRHWLPRFCVPERKCVDM